VSAHISPAWRWSSEEVFAYIAERDLPLNPLYRQQVELGVPEHRARVGLIVDGWSLEQGRWAIACALAPDECRHIETVLPVLADWR
ncbi:MAG: phosphoadenosine phosphosulfate reductase family protein, partial [Kocuria sp.]|nr:phosphoadenosine phosphosulfate reductase family protein [Kocuria sp.]